MSQVPSSAAASTDEAPRKRTRIQLQNEARIVEAALDLFGSLGFGGTTVDDIAQRAGIARS